MFHVFRIVSLDFSRDSSETQNLYKEEARNFPMSLRLYKEPQPIWVESPEFFKVLGHSSKEKALYDDSLYWVPEAVYDDSQHTSLY